MSCRSVCGGDGKACSDALRERFHLSVRFFQAVPFKVTGFLNRYKCLPLIFLSVQGKMTTIFFLARLSWKV